MKNNFMLINSHPIKEDRFYYLPIFELFLILFFSLNTIAQISLTHDDMMNFYGVGQRLNYYQGVGSSTVDVGKTGGPNIYDFRTLQFNAPLVSTVRKITDIPQLIGHYPDSAVTFGILNNPVFLVFPDSVPQIGNYSISASLDTVSYIHILPPMAGVGRFPVSYGRTLSSVGSYVESTYVNGNYDHIKQGGISIDSMTIDGFGQLRIGSYDMQCLRAKQVRSGPHNKTFFFFTKEGVWLMISTVPEQPDTGNISAAGYLYILGGSLVNVNDKQLQSPYKFVLNQNYPNPFNPATSIKYMLPKNCNVLLQVYNLLGQEVATLVNKMQFAGDHDIEWNAAGFSSGIYFYRLQAGGFIETKKLILLR